MSAARKVILTLFSSSNCSLCSTAQKSILNVQKEIPFTLKIIDIHQDSECPKEYKEKYIFDIPVLHLNGQFLMQHRVSETALAEAIKHYRKEGEVEPKY